jgi:[ribosomal protein S18]-alanine N-acetyltransferase
MQKLRILCREKCQRYKTKSSCHSSLKLLLKWPANLNQHTPDITPTAVSIEDLNGIMVVENTCFTEEDRWSEESMRQEIEKNPRGLSVIRDNVAIVGYAQCQIGYAGSKNIMGSESDGIIGSIAVLQTHRRLGLGSILMEDAILKLKEGNASKILLTTRSSNDFMRKLAYRYGFKVTGVEPGHYPNPDGSFESGLRMERPV